MTLLDKIRSNKRFNPRTLLNLSEHEKSELWELTQQFPVDTSLEHRVRMIRSGNLLWPTCGLEGCFNPVMIGTTNGFYICQGCCSEHTHQINSIRSRNSQVGKKRNKTISSDKWEAYIQKLSDLGYSNILKKEGTHLEFLCPQCQTVFSRKLHNALVCSPLCKRCSDKNRGHREATTLKEYQDVIEESGTIVLSQFETQRQHLKLELKCSCGQVFTRLGYTAVQGTFSCPQCSLKSSVSKKELELKKFVQSLGIEVIPNFRAWSGYRYEIDVYIPEQKIGIEFNGTFWHSDRNKTKTYHKDKTDLARAAGIRLITVCEHEWTKKPELVKNKLSAILGHDSRPKTMARKCQVKSLTASDVKPFLEQTHVQGFKAAKEYFGLVDLDGLVSVLSLVGNKIDRYSSSKRIVGGFNKLLHHVVVTKQLKTLETYCDLRWSDLENNVYSRAGFVLTHITQPGYVYIDSAGTVYSRLKFQKYKLVEVGEDPLKTEEELMKDKGFLRMWDCGHAHFVKKFA